MIASMIPVDFRSPISNIRFRKSVERYERGIYEGLCWVNDSTDREYGICHVCFFPSLHFATTKNGYHHAKSLCQMHFKQWFLEECSCRGNGTYMRTECHRNFKHLFLI